MFGPTPVDESSTKNLIVIIKMAIMSILVLLCAILYFGGVGAEWGYEGPNGPDHWCGMDMPDNQCCGGQQSPINIVTASTVQAPFHLQASGLDRKWPYVNLTNDVHSVTVRVPSNVLNVPTVNILHSDNTDTYCLDSLHFHFGNEDGAGSEHQIDGQNHSMEMHTVFYNSKYSSFTNAKLYSDGVVVIGVHFYISYFDNLNFLPITDAFDNILLADQEFTITPGFAISDLLPNSLTKAYSYSGSLTTPVCNEAVQWFVLKEEVPISENQMQQYRELTTFEPGQGLNTDLYMSNNYRPVQPLNGRVVYNHN